MNKKENQPFLYRLFYSYFVLNNDLNKPEGLKSACCQQGE